MAELAKRLDAFEKANSLYIEKVCKFGYFSHNELVGMVQVDQIPAIIYTK